MTNHHIKETAADHVNIEIINITIKEVMTNIDPDHADDTTIATVLNHADATTTIVTGLHHEDVIPTTSIATVQDQTH